MGSTWIRSVLAVLVVALLAGCASTPPDTPSALSGGAGDQPTGAAPDGPVFGTLLSSVEHSAEEARANVSAAMVELIWDKAEPSVGEFDEGYLNEMRDRVEGLRASGRTVTLGFGLHYPPRWVFSVPDSRLVDETGKRSEEANLIFNQELRVLAEGYLERVADVIDLREVAAVRLTSGSLAEVIYPNNDHYWAFDRNAQNGPRRPPSMPPNPAPGWRPGQDGLSEDGVQEWAEWYVGALVDTVRWQIATFSRLGFRNNYEVLTPGVGVLPRHFRAAVSGGLRPGLLGTGGAWHEFYRQLPKRPDVVAYVSSVADISGANGGDDECEPKDQTVPLDSPEVESWSATRWLSRVAGEYGFPLAGENPGVHQSKRLAKFYVDMSDKGMLAVAIRQVRSCGFKTFYWAHEAQLWDGTIPFDAYAEAIKRSS